VYIVTSRHTRLNGKNEPVNIAIMRSFIDNYFLPSYHNHYSDTGKHKN
jgi:hypothetical protein